MRAPTIRRLFGGVRAEEQPRSALRLFFAPRFARLRGDSLLVVVRGLLLPPAVGQGCYLHPFTACSAAGKQRNILSPRQVPPAAVALRNAPAGAALCAPAVFAPRFARLRGIAAQAKKTAAVKGNGCRAPCSLSGFLHHKTPCGKYLRKKYHTMVLPVTQV